MKRLAVLLALVLTTASLAACGKTKSEPEETKNESFVVEIPEKEMMRKEESKESDETPSETIPQEEESFSFDEQTVEGEFYLGGGSSTVGDETYFFFIPAGEPEYVPNGENSYRTNGYEVKTSDTSQIEDLRSIASDETFYAELERVDTEESFCYRIVSIDTEGVLRKEDMVGEARTAKPSKEAVIEEASVNIEDLSDEYVYTATQILTINNSTDSVYILSSEIFENPIAIRSHSSMAMSNDMLFWIYEVK